MPLRCEVGTMANAEHLRKLKEGINAWNRWRLETYEEIIDLSGTDLRGADFSRADSREAMQAGLAKMLSAVLEGQGDDGSWRLSSQWPPIGSSAGDTIVRARTSARTRNPAPASRESGMTAR